MTHPDESASKIRNWWPALAIVGGACLFCWPVFLGRIMMPADMCLLMLPWRSLQHHFPDFYRPHNPMFDPIQQYLPWRIYAVESLRAGFLPLWNPYAFCGTPFLANLQSTVLYPLNLLFLITGARHGFGVSAILHLTLGGLFMYAFLRTLALARPAALLGALILMFNGFTVSWLEFPTMSLWVFMWLPAVLLAYERSLRTPRSVWPVLCALALAIQFLGGHLQISAYVVIAFLLYAVARIISREERAVSRPLAAAIGLGSLAVGLALAAGQLLPTLELAQQTGRAPHAAAEAARTAFPLSHFILYLVPNFFGSPVHYNYWGNVADPSALNFFETACYVGVLPLLLAVWALRRWREQTALFFTLLAIFALLVAVGSPLYRLLYYLTPGFRQLAGVARVLCLAAFGLAGLAAVGLDDLLGAKAPRSPRSPLLVAFSLALVVALALGLVWPALHTTEFREAFPDFPPYLTKQILFFFLLAAAGGAVVTLRARLRIGIPFASAACIGLVALDLFAFGIGFNPFVDPRMAYPETDSIRWLKDNVGHHRIASLASNGLDWMAHNSPMIFGLRDIHGSDSLRPRRSFELASGPDLAQADYPAPDSPLMDLLAVKYLITRRPVSDGWVLRQDAEVPIYENLEALPRAYFQSAAQELASSHPTVGQELASSRPTVGQELPSSRPTVGQELASCPQGSLAFERDDPDAITLQVTTDQPAQVVLTDSYYPGWRARVDGRPSDIRRVNYAFRGVLVPAGNHSVELAYEPASFQVGLFASLVALLLLAAAGPALYLRGRPSAAATASRS